VWSADAGRLLETYRCLSPNADRFYLFDLSILDQTGEDSIHNATARLVFPNAYVDIRLPHAVRNRLGLTELDVTQSIQTRTYHTVSPTLLSSPR